MKIRGKKIEGRNTEIIPIFRDGEPIYFVAEALLSYDEFDKLVQEPVPPTRTLPGGVQELDYENGEYLKKRQEYAELKTSYLILKSLQATPDLEWETVDFNKPGTWKNYQTELKNTGFSEAEIYRIIDGVSKANSMNERMIEKAREDFLRGRVQQKG